MTRLARSLWLALAVLLTIAPLVGGQARAEEPTAQTPVGRFGSCVRGGGHGSILMLFDRSGSLQDTDPDNARVTSAKYLVEQLAAKLGGIDGASVDIALAGFDHSYERSLDWTPLTAEGLGPVLADLDAYAERNDGAETDYWKAVDGARKELAARQEGSEARGCALMVWFSDGGFAIGQRKSEEAVARYGGLKPYDPDNELRTADDVQRAMDAGATDMCRVGGVADQLRSLDIVSVGIGLDVEGSQDFGLMQGFTSAEGQQCGDITEPKPGEFLMASDIDELILAFDSVLDETPAEPVETGVCVDEECAEGTRTFVLDGSIGKVQALAQVPVADANVLLRTREGETVELSRDGREATVPGAKLQWQWLSDNSVSLELDRDGQSEQWVGPWALVFVAATETSELAKSVLRLYGDILPAWTNSADVTVRADGAPVELRFGATDGAGAAIDPATLSDRTFLDIALEHPDGQSVPLAQLPAARFGEPVPLEAADLPVGTSKLRVVLDVTTMDWNEGGTTVEGTRLEPVSATFPLKVLPPEEFPTILDKISFGSTETADPVTVTVPLTGAGCAWLGDQVKFTGYPQGLDQATLTSPAKDQASCATEGLPLTLTPGDVGNGALVGTAQVWLKSPNAAEGTPVQLAFDLQMSRPVSQPVLWSTFALVLALGILIPLGFLYLVKYLTARIPGQAVLAARLSGPVDDARAFTDAGIQLDVSQMAVAHLANDRRRVEIAGVTLRTRTGLALTEPGYVVVEQPGRAAGGRGVTRVGERAKLPLAVQGTWTVALDPQRPASGDVVVTVFTGPGGRGLPGLLDEVRSNVRDVVAALRDGLPPDPAAPVADQWGGGPTTGAGSSWDRPPTPTTDPWTTPTRPASGAGGWQTPSSSPAPGAGGWNTPPSAPPRTDTGGWQNPPETGGRPPTGDGAGW